MHLEQKQLENFLSSKNNSCVWMCNLLKLNLKKLSRLVGGNVLACSLFQATNSLQGSTSKVVRQQTKKGQKMLQVNISCLFVQ